MTTIPSRTIVWAVLTTLAASAAVWAAKDAGSPAGAAASDRQSRLLERFPEADADGDGTLTREEAKQFMQSRRQARRGDGAGKRLRAAGSAEPKAAKSENRPSPEQILKDHPEADTDGDGTLSRDELRAFGRKQHGQRLLETHPELDKNGDGVLSDEEMRAGRRDPGFAGRGRRAPAPRPEFFDWLIEHFAEADADGSGQLSLDELKAFKQKQVPPAGTPLGFELDGRRHLGPSPERLLERFPDADTDGDGRLSDEELGALRERLGRRGPGAGARRGFGAGRNRTPPPPPAPEEDAAETEEPQI